MSIHEHDEGPWAPSDRLENRVAQRATLPGGGESILIIDDEPLVQKVNAAELGKLGYHVVCASGCEEALAYLREHDADLILLDLMMPGVDGVETFRRIRALKPDQKALVYSGYAPPEQAAEAQRIGAEPILIKPTPLEELAVVVRAKLDASTTDDEA